jgi:hypothetical protein
MSRIAALVALLAALPARAEPFSFVALGDAPYNGERDYPVYRNLIKTINTAAPAFSIFIGDIWGIGECHDRSLQRIDAFFRLYEQPLIYTPGDNEWVDCGRRLSGAFAPAQRLQKLRSVFFKDGFSLGRSRMPLVRQSAVSKYKAYVENARWEKSDVLFVTLHIPGSSNGYRYDDPSSMTEASQRTAANIAWLRDSFRIARERDMKAVVLAYHAEMFGPAAPTAAPGPYTALLREIRLASDRFARPVLLVHGDAHQYKIDRPLMELQGESSTSLHANITRLQVFGSPEIKAVKIGVDIDTPWVFSFSPLH